MLNMRMVYDDQSRKSGKGVLLVYGIGSFPVLSGRHTHINDPNCEYLPDEGSIPIGRYWIVQAPTGGLYTKTKRAILDYLHNTDHSEWFGLYNSRTMDDYAYVNGVKRTGFRLHPLRPDGKGESWGCITLFKVSDFAQIRQALLRTSKMAVPGSRSGLMAYGYVDVVGKADYAQCVN